MEHKLHHHNPEEDGKFRTLTIEGKKATVVTVTVGDRHPAMLSYQDHVSPPEIVRQPSEPDWAKADPLFRPDDYVPPKKAGGKRKALDPDHPKYKAKNDYIRLNKRKMDLLTLGQINFNRHNSSFVTLTFDPKKYSSDNLAFCHKAFNSFMKLMRYHYSGIQYIVVFERGLMGNEEDYSDGHYHIHMLWNVRDLDKAQLVKYWKKGFVEARQNFDSIHTILTYMSKEFRDTRKFGHAFDYSRGLHRPKVLRDSHGEGDEIDRFFEEQGDNIYKKYENLTANTDFVDSAEYELYHLVEPYTDPVPIAKLKRAFDE